MPHSELLQVTNSYGNTHISSWRGTASLTTQFGEVHLNQLYGNIRLDVAYGDVVAEDVEGEITATTRKTNFIGHDLAGSLRLDGNYGEVDITTQDRLTQVGIDVSRTEVSFATSDPQQYYYTLETVGDAIRTPLPGNRSEGSSLIGKTTFQSHERKETQPIVSIKTSYSPITIYYLEHDRKPTARSAHRP